MKRKVLLFPLFALIGGLAVSSYSSGPYQSGTLNRTGSLGTTANCAGGGCHASNSANTTVTIAVTNQAGDLVTSWIPGNTYIVRVAGTNSNGRSHFGFQSTIVRAAATGTQAGSFTSTGSVSVRTASTPDIVEHNSAIAGIVVGSTTGYLAQYTWTAPAAGTGTVRILATLNAVNRDNGTNGDEPQANSLDLAEGSGTSVPGVSANSLSVYPNPAGASLWLRMPDAAAQGQYLIRDIRGSIVARGQLQLQQGLMQVDLGSIAGGAYFVQVQAGDATMVTPFVKQ